MAQKHQQLHKLEMMKMQIDSASDNHRVLDTLAASSRALQQTTGGTKGLAKAEETVAQLHESVQDAEEVSSAGRE